MGSRTPLVLVDVSPAVFAESVGLALVAAGFRVRVGPTRKRSDRYDAAVVGPGRPGSGAPIEVVVGAGSRVTVRQGSETGVVSAEGPGDLARLLRMLFADKSGRASSSLA